MTTYYIDYENGNDSNDGTSFANRKATIPSSWTLNGGDEVRIMGSPDPTLVGTGNVRADWQDLSYNGSSFSATIDFSTTTGDTTLTSSAYNAIGNKFPSTGGTIFIYDNSFSGQAELNGTWTVTKVNSTTIKLDGYTATSNSSGNTSTVKFFIRSNCTIMLNSAVTQNVASYGPRTSTWTASTNVTTSLEKNGSFVWTGSNAPTCEHYYSDKIEISDSFGTGKAAYWATGALDLSGYQQISFKLLGDNTTQYYGSNCSLRLCSDSSGNTTVNTLNFDLTGHAKHSWAEVVFDLGSNFGNNINSIALYVDTDQGAQDFIISNIIACKSSSSADSLTHRSIIGLNTTADPCWYGIESINGKRVILESKMHPSSSHVGYYGCWQNAGFAASLSNTNIYKRETNRVKAVIDAMGTGSFGWYNTNSSISHSNITSNNWITVSGGWDRTNMSSQSLDSSFLDLLNKDNSFTWSSFAGCNLSKVGFVRGKFNPNSWQYASWEDINCVHLCTQNAIYSSSCSFRKLKNFNVGMGASYITFTTFYKDTSTAASNPVAADASSKDDYEICCTGGDITTVLTLNYSRNMYFGKITARGSTSTLKLEYHYTHCYIDEYLCTTSNHGLYANNNSYPVTINNYTAKNIGRDVLELNQDKTSPVEISNFVYTEDTTVFSQSDGTAPQSSITKLTKGFATFISPQIQDRGFNIENAEAELRTSNDQFTGTYASNPLVGAQGPWYRRNANNVNGVYESYFPRGLIKNDTSTRHTSSGYSWSFYNYGVHGYPQSIDDNKTLFGKFAVASGSQVSVKIWVLASNSNVPAALIIEKNTLIGMTADVIVEPTSYSSSWQEITAQLTPTSAGFIDVYVSTYGNNGANTNYFDDMSISQA